MRKAITVLAFLLCLAAGFLSYFIFWMPNILAEKRIGVKIPSGSGYTQVIEILRKNNVLKSEFSFSLVSRYKHYPEKVKSGYYVFNKGLNNRQIVNMLAGGLQTPVTLVIYNIRTREDFAGLVGRTLELDSSRVIAFLNCQKCCEEYHLDTNTILSMFIADNYEFYWNTSLEKFLDKTGAETSLFWNENRKAKAAQLQLTVPQITTLASIVEKEVIFDKELPMVAGVYMNRLKIGMPLQADPTLVFALRDFDARRVNQFHKEFDSPFNTYKYAGLPPGPICIPRKKSIDAVLNYQEHNFLYFCANPDRSGYSVFSKTYEEQMKIAIQYRTKMDEMNVH